MTKKTPSKLKKLLMAAGSLAEEGRNPFSSEDLVVRAFEISPDDFSLKGYPEYPNSNAVYTKIMGKQSPLVARGWLEKVGTQQYRITSKGLDDLAGLQTEHQPPAQIHLDRTKLEVPLGRLLKTSAFEKFKAGDKDQITFYHSCRFFGITARDKWQKVAGKIKRVEHLVARAKEIGEAGHTVQLYVGRRNVVFTPEDLRMLNAVCSFLVDRFADEMDQWQKNTLN